ncbi:methyltransferase [Leptospira perolatii]|uniref:Methyltransferase n=1 Tax=Leptospira perolatii TaxID=2023191 RepID=A0A2M9ZQ53_9LEPT|nr:class I SAM-dependent methyltransferase [Leptospira perolatii]PJZ68315.1 methyltransferase [Leptospira perolatii]PJZ74218.1 methyltransferase [Leptospira perolatii]
MISPKQHYENFLSEKYAWMLGDLPEKEKEELELFESWGFSPQKNGYAWDLGSGNGVQSLPLAKLGFKVLAIDFSENLLNELKSRSKTDQIQTKVADIRDPTLYTGESPELLICMGDTLTHLESQMEVGDLLSTWASFLMDGAKLVLGYRDLSSGKDGDKIGFVVRSEREKIFSCLLTFATGIVEVTDIFHEWNGGSWNYQMSTYHKIVLPLDRMIESISKRGFALLHQKERNGMQILCFEKGQIV